jgi:hypothetical protein
MYDVALFPLSVPLDCYDMGAVIRSLNKREGNKQ